MNIYQKYIMKYLNVHYFAELDVLENFVRGCLNRESCVFDKSDFETAIDVLIDNGYLRFCDVCHKLFLVM